MYAEIFGIESASDAVEAAAQWVQWAQSGILAGAIENEASIRYNLGQFWNAKAAAYGTEDEVTDGQLDRLDTFAHGLWNALETAKTVASPPSYWSFWKSYIGGGTPDRPEAIQAATAAAVAAAGQEAAAKRTAAQDPAFSRGMTTLAQANAANAANDLRAANGLWTQSGILPSPLGIPLWAWAVGALGLWLVLRSK